MRDRSRSLGLRATIWHINEGHAAFMVLERCREHVEQGVRACLGVLRLAGSYGKDRLELACERALAAGTLSARYVEQLLRADRRRPFLEAHPEDGVGPHGNVRGPAYYN